MKFHDLANIFPLIYGTEFVELKQDIKDNGLREPIWIYDDLILDGRNRFRACQETGVSPEFRNYEGDKPLEFVLSLNLHRRHLNESQRAMVAANISNLEAHRPKNNTANLRTSQADAAEKLNVSERTVNSAKKVQANDNQELIEAVQQGDISVSAAATITTFEESEQDEILEEISEGVKPAEAIKNRVHISNKNNDWYTPEKYIESARTVMGVIDTDPASSELAQETVKAGVFYTVENNGLDKTWIGNIWMNPPYSMPEIENFIDKLLNSDLSQWIVLTNNSSDTGWFHKLLNNADSVCFTKGRVGFQNIENEVMATRQGQTFFYKGNNISLFEDEYRKYGAILEIKHVYSA